MAVWAHDVEALCAFYESLGATRGQRYDNSSTGFSSYFLSWPDSPVQLEVMHTRALDTRRGDTDARTVGWAHIALALGTMEAVDRMAAECAARGVPVVDGPRRTGDGYYECVVTDPEGNRVELTV